MRHEQQNRNQKYNNSINCLQIWKFVIALLVFSGMIVFSVYFFVEVYGYFTITNTDFKNCQASYALTIALNSRTYIQVINGLTIGGLVSSAWTLFHLILIFSYFTNCLCCQSSDKQQQMESDSQFSQFGAILKLKMIQNISKPKASVQASNFKLPSEKLRQKIQSKQINKLYRISKYHRQDLKPFNQIQRIQRQEQKYQYQDFCGCIQFIFKCSCCRTCCQAHIFLFYRSKGEQIFYWIFYLLKTCCIATLLSLVLMIYVSLNNLDLCFTTNINNLFDKINVLMIIGIITLCLDVFGYLSMCIQGTFFQSASIYKRPNNKIFDQFSTDQQKQNLNLMKKRINKTNNDFLQQKKYDKQTPQETQSNFAKFKDKFYQNNKRPEMISQQDIRLIQSKISLRPQNLNKISSRYEPYDSKNEIQIIRNYKNQEVLEQETIQRSRFSNKYQKPQNNGFKYGAYGRNTIKDNKFN